MSFLIIMQRICRCDSVDPSLAWTGVKDSGRGVSCSKFGEHLNFSGSDSGVYGVYIGYDQLTRPKSVFMKS